VCHSVLFLKWLIYYIIINDDDFIFTRLICTIKINIRIYTPYQVPQNLLKKGGTVKHTIVWLKIWNTRSDSTTLDWPHKCRESVNNNRIYRSVAESESHEIAPWQKHTNSTQFSNQFFRITTQIQDILEHDMEHRFQVLSKSTQIYHSLLNK